MIGAGDGVFRVASIYLPNGNPAPGDKYDYKLRWMERLRRHAADLLAHEEPLVLAGDYNVIPHAVDCRDPALWAKECAVPSGHAGRLRAAKITGPHGRGPRLQRRKRPLHVLGLSGGAWQRNNGIRIDHLLLSPQAADRLSSVAIDRDERAHDKPSDHVPVRGMFRI